MSDTREHAPRALWAGRFSDAPDVWLQRFGASLPVDSRLWREDIDGSKAHATMLAEQGIISHEDATAIVEGLEEIASEIEAGSFVFDVDVDEDVHMAIERALTERIGEAGGRLHTGRSRNDQGVLDTRLASRNAASELGDVVLSVAQSLLSRAEAEMGTIMPGYTHLQPAQPVLLSHHLLAYVWMFLRDAKRFRAAYDSANVSPLGAAALAGTTYPLDREATASALGMDGVIPNSMDAVSDRDFALDLVYACSVCQMHLSRLCEELILWSSAEFGFVEMDDAHSTGSSIMPQKKNPDFAELVRGKSGRVVGDLMSLLTMLKGLPLTYDKDLQEDKETILDASDTVRDSLIAMQGMVETLTFKAERMREAALEGYMAATDLADYLVTKGMPFREAHGVVGALVASCVERGIALQDLSAEELAAFDELFDEGAVRALDIEEVVRKRTTYGGTGHDAVRIQIAEAKAALEKKRA